VTVDELAGLGVVLGVTVAALLDPTGPQRSSGPSVDVGGRNPLPPPIARKFISDPQPDDTRAHHVAALAGIPNPINSHQEDSP
jgi:hypothetical protein